MGIDVNNEAITKTAALADREKVNPTQSATPISDQIRAILEAQAKGQSLTSEQVAKRLNLSFSTVRRRLENENTSYREIKDGYRRDIAVDLLKNTKLRVHEVSDLTGYSETTSFVRSFRCWTGMTPTEYRLASAENKEGNNG